LESMVAKRRKPSKPKFTVQVTYQPVSSAEDRLRRCMEILLSRKVEPATIEEREKTDAVVGHDQKNL